MTSGGVPPAPAQRRARARGRARPPRPAAIRRRCVAMARAVVDEERARLAGRTPSGAPSSPEALGAEVAARLAALERDRRTRARRSTRPASSSTPTSGGRRGPRPRSRPRARPPPGRSFLELDRETGRRGRRFRAAEDAARRADRRRGRADRHQQRRRRRARRRAGRPRRRRRVAAASSSRSAAASGSRRSCGARAPGWSRWGRRTAPVSPTSRRPSSDGRARLVLRVHPSNFGQTGFVEAPDAAGARGRRAPARRASSSTTSARGALLDTARFGLAHEPMPTRAPRGGRGPRDVLRRQARRRARRRGSSPAARTSSSGSGRTRWRGRCARTRSSSPRVAATLAPVPRRRRARARSPSGARSRAPVDDAASSRAAAIAGGDAGSRASVVDGRSDRSAAARCRARRCRRGPSRSTGPRRTRLLARLRAGDPGRHRSGRATGPSSSTCARSSRPTTRRSPARDRGGAGRRWLSGRWPTRAGPSSSAPPGTSTTARPACCAR